jgi:Ca-activated chloride channel family protein
LALESVGPRTGGAGGSLLGDAIRLAADSFTGDTQGSKAIIVLSDGDDMDSWPIEAAASAQKSGIRVWTIGLGDAETGARIPIEVNGERLFFTHNGEEVWVRMQGELLEQIAKAGNGAFIAAGTSNLDLGDVYEQVIAPGSGRRTSTAMIEQLIPRYAWFITPALVLLIAEWLLGRCWPTTSSQSRTERVQEMAT